MLEEIKSLVECEDKEVAAKADEVVMIYSAFEEGQISRDELEELLRDIARTQEIAEEGADIRFKSMLVTGIYGILQVV